MSIRPGQQGRAGQIDHLGARRDGVALLADGGDPAVGDDHQRIVDILARAALATSSSRAAHVTVPVQT
jgi:hypothetical protein